MTQGNMTEKIRAIKALFKNISDIFLCEEINDIRTKIYRNTKLYEYYGNKTNLNDKQTNSLNKAINNFKKLHENLLYKEPSISIIINIASIIIHPMNLINYLSTMNTTSQ